MAAHALPIRVYYEDTDHSGVVYHANYLKYFERAREHLLGPDTLVALLREEGLGFVVYRCDLRFREGAAFGDTLTIHTHVTLESPWRAVFRHRATRDADGALLVEGTVELACVDAQRRLVRIPAAVTGACAAHAAP
jgi:tol-pal system-associated acyl-CoA thioesterase